MDALLTLNRLARERVEADKGKDGADQRFNFGLYFFDDELSLDEQQGSDSDG